MTTILRPKVKYEVRISPVGLASISAAGDKHARLMKAYVDLYTQKIALHMADGNRYTVPIGWFEDEVPDKEPNYAAGGIASGGLVLTFGQGVAVEVSRLLRRLFGG